MTNDQDGRVGKPTGLSQAEPEGSLGPTGFDPSRLKARRKELKLSLRDVERATGFRISNAYISQLENGKIRNPSLGMTLHLATIYKVPMDTMIEWLAPEIKEPPRCPTCKQVIWPPAGAVLG